MNSYLPQKAVIEHIRQETTSTELDIKTYRLRLASGEPFPFLPGQFVELGVPGEGEAPFGFYSSPLAPETFEVTIKRTGSLTGFIHALNEGDALWVRGPFGNHFPLDEMENADLLFVAGGLGLAPLRPAILSMLAAENRPKYGQIEMLLAARTAGEHIFAYEYDAWRESPNTALTLTIDSPMSGWPGKTGYPHVILEDFAPKSENTRALVCGPPPMIKAVAEVLKQRGVPQNHIYTTLEMRMSCGVGKCGRCNIGRQYVCVDGPVFRLDELSALPAEY